MNRWTYEAFGYRRRPARTVHVGDVAIGSDHPIRVQSMTTPSTQDTAATVEQIVRLVDAGCEIVRVTVPTTRDADNLPHIRRRLKAAGVSVPLVADIHFTPAAAMRAIEHVDKIRVNPGNYADKKKFAVREYSDVEYRQELERIEQVFSPLVLRARELGVSMRIGTNHGSLSDRIMNRYGDTPLGMVESALEFVRICEGHGYHELILSMKASNPVVVLQVYRLLAERMSAEDMDYPFHLGVTEAGDGEDGRIKSALGIGALLDDGIGDTVRVSLTEDPVAEIPVARQLVERYNRRHAGLDTAPARPSAGRVELRDPHSYSRRESEAVEVGPHRVGGVNPVLVEVPLELSLDDESAVKSALDGQVGVRVPEEVRAEVVSLTATASTDSPAVDRLRRSVELVAPRVALSVRVDPAWLADEDSARDWIRASHRLHVCLTSPDPEAPTRIARLLGQARSEGCAILCELGDDAGNLDAALDRAVDLAASESARGTLLLTLTPSPDWSPLHGMRLLAARLDGRGLRLPVVCLDEPARRGAAALLDSSAALGGLLCDGIGDSIQLRADTPTGSRSHAFAILQAARVRITRTEFISCPSCGRTLFDLEETTARIKSRTAHLKGVKIAVMGCVVNGPGEMADADFGYVGWGEDKIALFVGKEMVGRDIPTAEADDRLVELIKQHGRWVDPPVPV